MHAHYFEYLQVLERMVIGSGDRSSVSVAGQFGGFGENDESLAGEWVPHNFEQFSAAPRAAPRGQLTLLEMPPAGARGESKVSPGYAAPISKVSSGRVRNENDLPAHVTQLTIAIPPSKRTQKQSRAGQPAGTCSRCRVSGYDISHQPHLLAPNHVPVKNVTRDSDTVRPLRR